MTRKKVGKAVSNRPLRACRVESIYFVWETPKHNSAGRVRTTVRLNVSHSTEDVNAGTEQTRLRLQIEPRTKLWLHEEVHARSGLPARIRIRDPPDGAVWFHSITGDRSGASASPCEPGRLFRVLFATSQLGAVDQDGTVYVLFTGWGQAGFDVEVAIAAHREPLDLPASAWCSPWRRNVATGLPGAKNAAIARIHVARNRRECAPCVYTRSSSYGQTGFPFCFLHSRSGFSKSGSRHGGCP